MYTTNGGEGFWTLTGTTAKITVNLQGLGNTWRRIVKTNAQFAKSGRYPWTAKSSRVLPGCVGAENIDGG